VSSQNANSIAHSRSSASNDIDIERLTLGHHSSMQEPSETGATLSRVDSNHRVVRVMSSLAEIEELKEEDRQETMQGMDMQAR